METPVIELTDLTVMYQNTTALRKIHCTIKSKNTAVLGHNGSGKSSFAYCLCNLAPIKKGTILYNKKPLSSYKQELWKEINMTFQLPEQQILMPSVKEEIDFGLKNLGLAKDDIAQRRESILNELDLASDSPCHSLSVGKKRLLSLLCILSLNPKTLILDEPTTFLDRPTERRILDIIFSLTQQIILITHRQDLIRKMDYAICFDSAQIAAEGLPQKVLNAYNAL